MCCEVSYLYIELLTQLSYLTYMEFLNTTLVLCDLLFLFLFPLPSQLHTYKILFCPVLERKLEIKIVGWESL